MSRTPLTYYGGKQRLAPALVALLPPHRIYAELFAGGAAVLFAKPRSDREILNDLDGSVAAFWRCVRDCPLELAAHIERTPYSREEWERTAAGQVGSSDVELAGALLTRLGQSYARAGKSWSPPSVAQDRVGRWQPQQWTDLPTRITAAAERLRGVCVERTDALALMRRLDLPDAAFYLDPPYAGEARRRTDTGHGYANDYTLADWHTLADALLEIRQAKVLLSGYRNAATERLEAAGWQHVELPLRRNASIRAGNGGGLSPDGAWTNYVQHVRLFDAIAPAEAAA